MLKDNIIIVKPTPEEEEEVTRATLAQSTYAVLNWFSDIAAFCISTILRWLFRIVVSFWWSNSENAFTVSLAVFPGSNWCSFCMFSLFLGVRIRYVYR